MREHNTPLMARINRMFGVIIALACVVLSIFSFVLNLKSQFSDTATQSNALLRTMAQGINTQLSQVELIVQELAYDKALIDLLQEENVTSQILSIAFSVDSAVKTNEVYLSNLSADLVVLSRSDDILESYSTIVHESHFAGDPFFGDFLECSAMSTWGPPVSNMPFTLTSDVMLPYYRKVITGMSTRLGTVRCAVSVRRLFSPLTQYDGQATLMVLRGGDTLFTQGEASMPGDVREGVWLEGQTFYCCVPLNSLNASLILCMPIAQIRHSATRSTALSSLAILLLGLALLLVTRRIVRAMLARLHSLADAVDAIPQGANAVALPEEGDDEVGRLALAFSSLLDRVSTYYDTLLLKEKDKRHAQSLALQYQINPHFLFNSLYWLQLKMEEQGVTPALPNSIEQLGRVLRYNLLGSREALLSEEREHILAYVDFVSAMKDGHIHLTEVVMLETLQNARILRFTLQPLLENAIQHGYVPGQDMHIRIAFHADEAHDHFAIEVHNDGRPIPPEKLQELHERLQRAARMDLPVPQGESGHGTALCNLARRLALTYGDDAQLFFDPGAGDTCVRILLPLSQCMRKETAHEHPDRR